MKYQRLCAEVLSTPWAITEDKFLAITEFLAQASSGMKLTEDEIQARLAAEGITAGPRPRATTPGTVALIPIQGIIAHRANMVQSVSGPGGTSIEQLTSSFRQAMSDPNVKAIVFDVDSPGGSVSGVDELASEIIAARGQKKMVAVANALAASAAYYLASAADEVVVTPSGNVGSIGVFYGHEDISKKLENEGVKVTLISAGKYKTEGSQFAPLSEEAAANLQAWVDSYYTMFVQSVAKGRGVTPQAVRGGFGQGRVVKAKEAVDQGMADRVATLDQTLERLGVGPLAQRPRASASTLRERELALYI